MGAGDAFMSGLLDGLGRRGLAGPRAVGLRGSAGSTDLPDFLDLLADPAVLGGLLDEAGAGAAITCGRAGADPPTRAEVDAFLAARRP
jgi:fructokinase